MTGSDPKSPRSIVGWIKLFAAFGFLVAVFMAGFTISSNKWSASNTNLQIDLRRAQEDLTQVRAELSQVKSEYALYREQYPFEKGGAQRILESPPTKSSTTETSASSTSEIREEVVVQTGNSVSVFDGDLWISLIDTPYEGNPLRHKVMATVGSHGYPNLKIESEDIGYVTTYNGKGTFEIRILGADTFSAKFLVIQIKDKSEPTVLPGG